MHPSRAALIVAMTSLAAAWLVTLAAQATPTVVGTGATIPSGVAAVVDELGGSPVVGERVTLFVDGSVVRYGGGFL